MKNYLKSFSFVILVFLIILYIIPINASSQISTSTNNISIKLKYMILFDNKSSIYTFIHPNVTKLTNCTVIDDQSVIRVRRGANNSMILNYHTYILKIDYPIILEYIIKDNYVNTSIYLNISLLLLDGQTVIIETNNTIINNVNKTYICNSTLEINYYLYKKDGLLIYQYEDYDFLFSGFYPYYIQYKNFKFYFAGIDSTQLFLILGLNDRFGSNIGLENKINIEFFFVNDPPGPGYTYGNLTFLQSETSIPYNFVIPKNLTRSEFMKYLYENIFNNSRIVSEYIADIMNGSVKSREYDHPVFSGVTVTEYFAEIPRDYESITLYPYIIYWPSNSYNFTFLAGEGIVLYAHYDADTIYGVLDMIIGTISYDFWYNYGHKYTFYWDAFTFYYSDKPEDIIGFFIKPIYYNYTFEGIDIYLVDADIKVKRVVLGEDSNYTSTSTGADSEVLNDSAKSAKTDRYDNIYIIIVAVLVSGVLLWLVRGRLLK